MGFLQKRKILVGIIFLLGVVLGYLLNFIIDSIPNDSPFRSGFGDTRENNSGYHFVNPLLSCEEHPFDHVSNDVLKKLEEDLKSYIATAKSTGRAESVSIYFRQLKGGPWLGINHENEFVPASLLKVPLAMAIYKKAEVNPGFLSTSVFFESGDSSYTQYYKNFSIAPNQEYFVAELLEAMLIHSDNNAAELLASILTDAEFNDTYYKLGIDAPNKRGEYSTSVHSYASFFRILWNATYLTPESSEELLETLSRSTFTKGIVSGLPPKTVVAHKFGERAALDSDLVQLHDCGIVYHPERPYLICVMTQGKNWDELAQVLEDISRTIWKSVD